MFRLFGKKPFTALLALLSLSTIHSVAMAEDWCDSCEKSDSRMYIGAFGGGLYSNSTHLVQRGTAFFLEAAGGPLTVDARGRARKNSAGFGGVQLGYECSQSSLWNGASNLSLAAAGELEAFFYHHTKKGSLINPTIRLDEHDFVDTFPMNVGVYLVNGVLSLKNAQMKELSPYIGGGIGAANLRIRKATSTQIAPVEAGVNHFDSDSSDSAWTFAAQVKAGLRYNIFERFHIFAEYRFLYVDSSRYIFGSTIAPGHVPTSTWNVDIQSTCYNAFAIGVQFDLT